MAENSDGSIVLSIKIDEQELNVNLDKIKSTLQNFKKTLDSLVTSLSNVDKISQTLSATLVKMDETLNKICNMNLNGVNNTSSELAKFNGVLQQNTTASQNVNDKNNQTNNTFNQMNNILQQDNRQINILNNYMSNTVINSSNVNTNISSTNVQLNIFQEGCINTGRALRTLATQLGIVFSLRQIINFSNEAGELASQTEAYLTRMSMLYGKSAQNVYDWANANSYALGMSKSTAYEAAAQYGNLFTTFTNAQESAKLSIEMLQATAVVASQTGRTYEETFEKMQSGIYGNTRAIDDLGISVRQSSLMQTKAWKKVSKDGTKSWNELTDAELQQLRVLGIIEQANDKYGNEVIQTTALTRAQFNSAWNDFKATWGTVVNGVLIPVLGIMTKIINAITTGLAWVAKFMGQTQSITSNIDSAAGGQGKLNKELEKTNKNLKKSLAGFDDLQILQSNNSSDTSSDNSSETSNTETSNTDGAPAETSGEVDVSPWQSAIAALVELLVGIGLVALGIILLPSAPLIGLTAIVAGLFAMGISLATLGNAFDTSQSKETLLIVTGLTGLLLLSIGVLLLFFGQIAWGISCLIAGIALLGFTLYESKSDAVSSDVEAWINGLFAIVSVALLVIGILLVITGNPATLPLGIGLILLGAAGLATVVAINWDFIKEKIEGIWKAISEFWNAYIKPGIDKVIEIIKSIWTTCIKPVIDWIVGGVTDLWNNHIKPLWTDHLQPAIQEISDKLQEFWQSVISPFLQAISDGAIWLWENGIKPAIDWIGDAMVWLWNEVILPFANYIKDVFTDVFKGAFEFIKTQFETLLDTAGGIIDGLKNIFSGLITFFTGIFTGDLGKAFDGIKQSFGGMIDGIKAIFHGILVTIINAINGFIDGLNFMIDIINKIPNVNISLIPNIEIPELAKGAVIPANHEFLAVLGDQKHGTNIEAPAELIKQMAMEAYQEMGLTGGQQQQIVKEEHYYLNQTELMTLMYKLAKGGERLNGASLVKQGGM